MKKNKIYAMIPARIGSTRFKKKNLALLNGKPLIEYSIDAAKKSNVFDKIILNSDDKIFSKIAKKNSIEFFQRPIYLGGSEIKSDDVLANFLDNFPCDIIVWENPIAPLQTVKDIRDCINYFLKNNLDCLFTVKSQQVQTIYDNKPVNFSLKGKFEQTQNLKPIFPFVPFLMMWRSSIFLETYKKKGHGFFCGKVGYYPVSRRSSVIIKYEEDFRLAESILKSDKNTKIKIDYYK